MIPGTGQDHPELHESFGYALRGLGEAVRAERNIKIMLGCMVGAIILGFFCMLEPVEWAVILLGCGTVLCAELLNTALEYAVDLTTEELHPLAGMAKDMAAGAVLILSLFVGAAGLCIYIPAIIERWLV